MIRTWLRAGVFAAALTGAVAVALAIGQQRRSAPPANGSVPAPMPSPVRTSRPASRSMSQATSQARPAVQPAAPATSPAATLDFYNVRTRANVAVPMDRVRKRRTVKIAENGRRQERFAAIAEFELEGRQLRLFKFISREQFEALEVPEEEA
jgi:hypothetical protein